MPKLRVLLADDHRIILDGLCSLLQSEPLQLRTAENGREALAVAEDWQPDIAVLDIGMPQLNGIDAARQIRKAAPRTRVIFLTMHADVSYVQEAFRAGACGYLVKRSAGSELRTAIREVAAGRSYISPQIADRVLKPLVKPGEIGAGADLTSRQREVLQLIAEGKANKEIANILYISVKTVEYHKSLIMSKLDLHSTAELTQYAIRLGLIDLDRADS